MCNLNEGIYEQGIEQGENLKAVETARNFLRLRKNSIEEISMCTGLSVEEVKKTKP